MVANHMSETAPSSSSLHIRGLTKTDFDRWWGGPSPERAHPIFFHEFGATALVAEDGEQLAGFLLGMHISGEVPTGYVHLVGIHPEHRRRGVGQELYRTFCERAQAAGMARVKAISTVGFEGPVRFHQALGFRTIEESNYAGRGRARLVFIKDL